MYVCYSGFNAAQWLRGESGVKSTNQQISHFYQALGEIAWHNNKWTNMIKIGQKILMITSLFYLRQYFLWWHRWFLSKLLAISVLSVTTEPTCLYQKTMASLLFIVYWCKHIFLMIIQIFTENILPLIFEPLISWT